MSNVIREYQEENDPKNTGDEFYQVPDLQQPEEPPQPEQEEVQQLPAFQNQSESTAEMPEGISVGQPGSVPATSEPEGNEAPQPEPSYYQNQSPIRPNEYTEITPDSGIFPSISSMESRFQPDEMTANELNRANEAFQNSTLTGDSYPSFYETSETRSRLSQMQQQQQSWFLRSPQQVERDLSKGNFEDAAWAEEQMQRLNEIPDLDSTRDIRERGTMGWVGNYGSRLWNESLGFGDEPLEGTEDLPQGHINPSTGEEFAPLRGLRKVAKDLKENPLRALGAMMTTPGTPFLAGSEWGDYGSGTGGFLLYSLDSIGRTGAAVATDIIRLSRGEFKEDEDTALLQSLMGRDFNFSSPQDHRRRTAPPGEEATNEKPLSTLSTSAQTPETWEDLGNRSWVWKPADWIMEGELPEFMKSKRLAQTAEFGAGLGIDIVTGGWADRAGLGIKKGVQSLFPQLFSTPKIPQNIDKARKVDDALRQFNEDFEADLWDDAVTPRADDPAVKPKDVETPTGIYKFEGDDATPHSFEMPVGKVEDDIHKVIVQDEIPIRASSRLPRTTMGDFPTSSSIEAPKYSFPSTQISEDGTERLLSPLNDINIDPDIPQFLNNESLQVFRRSNSDLTGLGISKGVVPPTRNEPLSSLRINHLNDANDGLFSRYGQDLSGYKFDVPEGQSDEALRTLQASDRFADNIIDPPKLKSDTIRYQRANLPRELNGSTDETLEGVADFVRRTQIHDDLAQEYSELMAKYSQEYNLVRKATEAVSENLPDIGRRTLLQNPPNTAKYAQPLNKYADDFQAVNQKLADEINSLEFYHGTKADFDMNVINPVHGAARSEMGNGIHFTNDLDLAIQYGGAQVSRNVPPVNSRQINQQGRVFTAKPRVRNPIDAAAPLTQDIKDQIAQSVNLMDVPSVAKTQLKRRLGSQKETYEKFMRDTDDILEKFFVQEGMDFPEEEALNLQRQITQRLRDNLGYDAAFYKSGDKAQLTLFGSPDGNNVDIQNVTELEQPFDVLSQSVYRNNVDAAAAQLFPQSSFAKVNAAESKVNAMTQALQRTADQTDDVGNALRTASNDMADDYHRLIDDVNAESGTRRAQKEAQWNKQNETQIQHWNVPEDGIC